MVIIRKYSIPLNIDEDDAKLSLKYAIEIKPKKQL